MRTPSNALPGEDGAVVWTAARKEELLRRLDEGEISINEAIARYHMTLEEIELMRAAHKVYGRRGLRLGQQRAQVPRPTSPQGQLL